MPDEFGATAWGRAWLRTIEKTTSRHPNPTLPKARSLARNHKVRDLTVTPGRIAATVTAAGDHRVAVELSTWTAEATRTVQDILAAALDDRHVVSLGDLPDEAVARLSERGIDLAPQDQDREASCDCRSRQSPCVHITACLYALVQAIDELPTLALTARSELRLDAPADELSLTDIDPTSFYGPQATETGPPGQHTT